MTIRAVVGALLLLAASLRAEGPRREWEPLAENYRLEHGSETYSVYVVRPHNVRRLLEAASAGERPRLGRRLWHNRAETNALLSFARDFVLDIYGDRGVFPPGTAAAMYDGVENLLSGLYPVLLVTRYHDPMVVYQTVSIGPDFGAGVPVERRLVGRGLVAFERRPLRAEATRMRYVAPGPRLEFDDEVGGVLSRIPRWVGALGEVRTFARAPYAVRDFAPTLHRLLLANQMHLWSGIPVPSRLPPLDGELARIVEELRRRHPRLPVELLRPELQEYVMNDRLVMRAGGRATAVLYRRDFAFDPPSQHFPDPDVPGVEAFFSLIERLTFETRTAELLQRRPHVTLVEEGGLFRSPHGALVCSTLLTRADRIALLNERPGAPVMSGFRLIGDNLYVVPPGGYLDDY